MNRTLAGGVSGSGLLSSVATLLDRNWAAVTLSGAGAWAGSFSTPGGVHQSFEVSVVLEGDGQVVVNGREIAVAPGDILVCDMRLPHRHVLAGLRLRYVNFQVRDETIRARARSLIAKVPTPFVRLPRAGGSIGGVLDDLDRLEREYRWKRPLGTLMAKAAFVSLLVRLARFADDPGGDATIARRVSSHLEANLGEPLRLSQIAARFSLTPRHLNVLFKRQTGTTIGRHLADLRMDRARRLLTHTDRSVTEIAHETGFCDCQHFCKVFRARTGCTASDYRRGRIR